MEKKYYDYLENAAPGCREILDSSMFRSLSSYPRHLKQTNTMEHSMRVAVLMARFSGLFGTDPESAVKTGLLHDMCYVNYWEKNDHPGLYCFYHPEEAAENGRDNFGLTETEYEAIRSHMFPLAVHVPKSRLALELLTADKVAAVYEGLAGIRFMHRGMRAAANRVLSLSD